MAVENKESLLYCMNKAYDDAKEVLTSQDKNKNESEVYYRVGTAIHWLIDCYDRIPNDLKSNDIEELFLALRGINNCLKHNKMLKRIQDIQGGKRYTYTYPYTYGICYIWSDLEYIEGMRQFQKDAYQKLLCGRKIIDSLENAVNEVNKYYEEL